MPELILHVLSLRYSSWSIRPFLALAAAGADFRIETAEVADLNADTGAQGEALIEESTARLARRRRLGSVTGLFPVLSVDGRAVHESLAICEWVADAYPDAGLWPDDAVERARARAVCCEMLSGFKHLRNHMSCHVFARVPGFAPDAATQIDIQRVFEIWSDALEASSGPLLFGRFSIADCMYFPVLTRFRTYDVALPPALEAYAQHLEAHPSVDQWRLAAADAPAIASYDEMIRSLGGDPAAASP